METENTNLITTTRSLQAESEARSKSGNQELSDGHKQNKVMFPAIVVTDESNNMQEKTAEREPNEVNLNMVSEASEANYPNAKNNSSQFNTNAISQLSAKQEQLII